MSLISIWFPWYLTKAGLDVSDMVDHYLLLLRSSKSCLPTQMMQFCRVPRMCYFLSSLVSTVVIPTLSTSHHYDYSYMKIVPRPLCLEAVLMIVG